MAEWSKVLVLGAGHAGGVGFVSIYQCQEYHIIIHWAETEYAIKPCITIFHWLNIHEGLFLLDQGWIWVKLFSFLITSWFKLKNDLNAHMAEWSKAPVSGTGHEGGVGSNPTVSKLFFFCFCNNFNILPPYLNYSWFITCKKQCCHIPHLY